MKVKHYTTECVYKPVRIYMVVRITGVAPQSQMEVFAIVDVLVQTDRIVVDSKHLVVILKHTNVVMVNVSRNA